MIYDFVIDTFTDLASIPSLVAGFAAGWFARKVMGRIWGVYYSTKRLGRIFK